jgi:hypothetical protein
MKSIRAMDAYVVVKEFFEDIDSVITNTSLPIRSGTYTIDRNFYCKIACCTIFAGVLMT